MTPPRAAPAHAADRRGFAPPEIHKFFDIPNNLGLSKVLVNDLPMAGGSWWQPKRGSIFTCSGREPPRRAPADQIGSGAAPVARGGGAGVDWVILARSAAGFPEPLGDGGAVDGVIVVTAPARAEPHRGGFPSSRLWPTARERGGLVLNEVRQRHEPQYYYYGHYEKYYKQPPGGELRSAGTGTDARSNPHERRVESARA